MKLRIAAVLLILSLSAAAGDTVPINLPRPDGKPGDATKPVKVYILAGQSNMVGFGRLSGARPRFDSIFLTADPAVIPGSLRIGRALHNLTTHGVYQGPDADAPEGAAVAVYAGAYDSAADYAKRQAVQQSTLALGTVSATLPSIDGPHTQVVSAFIDVPENGTYTVHAGYEASTHAVVKLDGKEVYRKNVDAPPVIQKVVLEKGKRYPVTITYMKGGSAAFWLEQIELQGKGDLETLTRKEDKFSWLIDDQGEWTVRRDVYYQEARIAEKGRGCLLSARSNGKHIGPEVPFGFVMGTYHDAQVLLIETSMGNRGLWWDFRPPSSGRTNKDGADKWEGLEYRLMVKGVRQTLENIDKIVPGYQGQGYEMAGFVWWQGHKDAYTNQAQEDYEKNLVNLINDVRQEFDAPDMPAVIATVGFGGYQMETKVENIFKAQMAVADPKKYPEFAGTVKTVDTRSFWRPAAESPTAAGYHYNHNAETYVLTGDALGRAMVELQGGKAAMRPQPAPPKTPAQTQKTEPTEAELAAHQAAVEPLIVDGMRPRYLQHPRTKAALTAAYKGEKPKGSNQFLRDAVDALNRYYTAVGIQKYSWHAFGPDMANATWHYISFDPPETMDKAKGPRYRKVTVPAGSENWAAMDFDPEKDDWKKGAAPFGQKDGKLVPLGSCTDNFCRCGVTPKTLWQDEVLLIRQTFEIPPLKDGHRYRLVIGGSAHVNAGEGFAVYVDGKLLAESEHGVYRRQGGQPRGGHVYADMLPEFQDGKITIAVKSFLRYNHPRTKVYPRGHLSVWLEEQKLPPR